MFEKTDSTNALKDFYNRTEFKACFPRTSGRYNCPTLVTRTSSKSKLYRLGPQNTLGDEIVLE